MLLRRIDGSHVPIAAPGEVIDMDPYLVIGARSKPCGRRERRSFRRTRCLP
jgi:hypothetical protein